MGTLSPKTVTSIVITPVAKPIPREPKASVAINVANDAAKIWTRLLLIVMVAKSLLGLAFNFAKAAAPGRFSRTSAWSLNLITEKIAV